MSQSEQAERLADLPVPPSAPSGGFQMSGAARQVIIMLVIAAAVSFGVLQFFGPSQLVSKKDFTATYNALAADIAAIKNAQKGDEGTLATLSTQVNGVSTQIQQLQSSAMTADKVNALISNQINPLQQTLNSLKASVDKLPTSQPDIAPLKTQLTTLQTSLDAIKADVAALKAAPTVPVSTPPTITGFSPTAGTTGTSVTITGTNLNGATAVAFGGVSAAGFAVNSGTQITATVANGATGSVSVTTPAGTATLSTTTFTYTGTTTTSGVTTTFTPTGAFNLPNVVNISITNNTGKDIFGGQFAMTVQYLDATPSSSNMVTLSATEILWAATGSVSGVSVQIVGSASGVFILNGQTKIISVNMTPPTTGTQFRVSTVTYTGWIQ